MSGAGTICDAFAEAWLSKGESCAVGCKVDLSLIDAPGCLHRLDDVEGSKYLSTERSVL